MVGDGFMSGTRRQRSMKKQRQYGIKRNASISGAQSALKVIETFISSKSRDINIEHFLEQMHFLKKIGDGRVRLTEEERHRCEMWHRNGLLVKTPLSHLRYQEIYYPDPHKLLDIIIEYFETK